MKSDAPQGGRKNAVPFLKTPAVYTATQRKGSKEKVKVLANESFLCPAFYSDMFSALNLVSFLMEQVQKCLQIFRFLLQNLCDHGF